MAGWDELVAAGSLGFLLGGVVGGALMVVRRAGRKSKIPFGPYMLSAPWWASSGAAHGRLVHWTSRADVVSS